MAPDPAVVVPLFLLAAVVLVPFWIAVGLAIFRARVRGDVRSHGGRVTSIRVINVLSRRPGFHVGLVDARGQAHQARAYPYAGRVFWRQGQQPLTAAEVLAGTALDAEWWRTPVTGPPGPQPQRWLPGDSPPTRRKDLMWALPVALGAFFLLGSLTSLSAFAWAALASGQWLLLALPALTAAVGVALVVWGLRLRR